VGDEEIRDRQYYLDKFKLNPNGGRYTYKYMDVKEVDSPKTD
jgi:hypothetical protein